MNIDVLCCAYHSQCRNAFILTSLGVYGICEIWQQCFVAKQTFLSLNESCKVWLSIYSDDNCVCMYYIQRAKCYFDSCNYSLASLLRRDIFFDKVKTDFCFEGYSFKSGNNLLFDWPYYLCVKFKFWVTYVSFSFPEL